MKQKEIFTPKDMLNLQQLKTRQFLAEDYGNGKSEFKMEEQTNALNMPQRWQLLKNDTVLHDWQKKCLKIWLDENKGRGTVKVATGGGKTIFALAAATELQNHVESCLRLVIVVPTIVLMHQWHDELKSANLPVETIGLMGGDNKTWRTQGENYRILIAVINSARKHLPKFSKDNGWSNKMLLVVDECHRANADEAQKIFQSNPKYTLGLSATPETSEANDSTLPSDVVYQNSHIGRAIGPIIFDFSLKKSLDAGLLTKFQIWHIGLALSGKENAQYQKLSREITELTSRLKPLYKRSRRVAFIPWCQAKANSQDAIGKVASNFIHLTSKRKLLLYGASARKEITIKILLATQEARNKKRTIVFHENIEKVNDIFLTALDNEIPAVLEHSKLKQSLRTGNVDAFRQNIATTIISAKSLIEGFNVPSADLGIIVASSGSVRQRIQSLGRMLRKKDDDTEALIIVLYVTNTSDEKIYEKVDWDDVIGFDRNRYFHWNTEQTGITSELSWECFIETLKEVDSPPRKYLPKCQDNEEYRLETDGLYPARPDGEDIRVDENNNLRSINGIVKNRNKPLIDKILKLNQSRHAIRTPCGHLIVRNQANEWIYLGKIALPKPPKARTNTVNLIIRNASGRRVIAKKSGTSIIFARNIDEETSEAKRTHDGIIAWIESYEQDKKTRIRKLFWDNNRKYWIEIQGTRIYYGGNSTISSLEFPE